MEQLNSIELCYMGQIDIPLDKEVDTKIKELFNSFKDLKHEWYFNESSISAPLHRLKGYSLSRPLEYEELLHLRFYLLEHFEDKVFLIRTT